ncbi:response regulator of citrate/malate metabolism [Rhizobium sp. BK529]|uniref:hypothetical protein n=1 Tax=Rhizobium sp. BK529 TaxID=2586983 RepID=UPI00161A566B|nr:hypothetical protein [Rhizobium sp. BK529]MBB3595918.1 response regulator of citrate/malate metabolism [Rhizobium sp. BK529]
MSDREYSAEELAEHYQISRQQALRYIARFGGNRVELDHLISSAPRTAIHRPDDVNRSAVEVALE